MDRHQHISASVSRASISRTCTVTPSQAVSSQAFIRAAACLTIESAAVCQRPTKMARSGSKWMNLSVVLATLLVFAAPMVTLAADEDPLQDFCVALNLQTPNPVVNGNVCKPVAATTAQDFKFTGLNKAANAQAAKLLAVVTPAFVAQFPGLNTLGLGAARIDFAKGGLNPPHAHPRASELFFLVEGTITAGFVSSNGNTLFQQTLNKGDLFVFPRGLLHFQKNVGNGAAWGIAFLNSQNAGTQQAAKALFASGLSSDVLQQTLGINQHQVMDNSGLQQPLPACST